VQPFLQMLVLTGVSFGLFILHSVEIWSHAVLYHWHTGTAVF